MIGARMAALMEYAALDQDMSAELMPNSALREGYTGVFIDNTIRMAK